MCSELRNCVKVEVGSPSLIVFMVSVDVMNIKQLSSLDILMQESFWW